MKTVAVIAEYNPFHNGHLYQLECARRRTGADRMVVLMCGDFTQRGEPVVLDKYSRAETVLKAGANLVIMMPVSVSISGAQQYADGCVKILDALGTVDYLSFGSECGTIGQLKAMADFFDDPPKEYLRYVTQKLSEGMTYASSRQAAMEMWKAECGNSPYENETCGNGHLLNGNLVDTSVLEGSNNILGIEYLKALLANKSLIEPSPVTRMGSAHGDSERRDGYCEVLTGDGEHTKMKISSASALRKCIAEGRISAIREYVPDISFDMVNRSPELCQVTIDDFSLLLHDRIMNHSSDELAEYYECSPELADRIKKREGGFTTFTGFAKLLKTKEMTYSRISRVLMHIVLGIKKAPDRAQYIRVLGFRDNAGDLMHEISVNAKVPMITKVADAGKKLDAEAFSYFKQDIAAAEIYNNVILDKFGMRMTDEYRKQFPVVR